MTRPELLRLLVGQARAHGFEFRKWFQAHTGQHWVAADEAIRWLATGKRAPLLLFSHDFARAFFRSGERVTFMVPPQTFQRVARGGGQSTVERRAHLRRSSRDDVWLFHLREMAAAAEPLRYIRRYLLVDEEPSFAPERSDDLDAEDYDEELMVRDADPPRSKVQSKPQGKTPVKSRIRGGPGKK